MENENKVESENLGYEDPERKEEMVKYTIDKLTEKKEELRDLARRLKALPRFTATFPLILQQAGEANEISKKAKAIASSLMAKQADMYLETIDNIDTMIEALNTAKDDDSDEYWPLICNYALYAYDIPTIMNMVLRDCSNDNPKRKEIDEVVSKIEKDTKKGDVLSISTIQSQYGVSFPTAEEIIENMLVEGLASKSGEREYIVK